VIAIATGYVFWLIYLNDVFPKYDLKVVDELSNEDSYTFYYDLNNDGEAELLRLGSPEHAKGRCFLVIVNNPFKNNSVISQNNWEYEYSVYSQIRVNDYNHDGIQEIFFFLADDSALYLEGLIPSFKPNTDADNFLEKPIDRISITKNGFQDFFIQTGQFIDINNDGFNEFIFVVAGGYTVFPRKIYVYDIKNDSLYSSPGQMAIKMEGVTAKKISGKYYYLPWYVHTSGNVHDTIKQKYHDWNAWVYLFNDSLKPAFPPIQLGSGYTIINYQRFVKYKGKDCFISVYNEKRLGKSISIYDLNGNLLITKELNNQNLYIPLATPDTTKYSVVVIYGSNVVWFDEDLNEHLLFKFLDSGKRTPPCKFLNVDSDPQKEFAALTNEGKNFTLFDDDLSFMFSLPLSSNNYTLQHAYKVKCKSDYNLIHLWSVKKSIVIGYKFNNNYYLSYLLAVLIIIIFFILIQLAMRQRLQYVKQKTEQEKQLIESQLKIAHRQMSPHFQLNVLNSISYLFEKDKEKAHYYLGKYSRLVTETMMNVDKIATTLENELNFTKTFLFLEQLRLDHKFEFQLTIDETVDLSFKIPRMLIFTFCENAVKHGLYPKKDKGLIKITIKKIEENRLEIVIDDNGIGRVEANNLNTRGTGMGLKTLDKILNYFNENKILSINYTLTDKPDSQGTVVVIRIGQLVKFRTLN